MAGGSPIREVKITNSTTGKKETLTTLKPGRLTMYSCGPTVYSFIHVGNLRTAIVSDMLFRYFKSIGYDVHYARNYTDVDDKIIERAKTEGKTPDEIAKHYTTEVERDYAAAGMLEPTYKTKATEHIQEMQALIEKMIARGSAYVVEGEVFFSVESFKTYGELSGRNTEELMAGARVEIDPRKRNPMDFSLWKGAKPGEPSWESPWGAGRPGWHIECSAMAQKWLGDQIDIHHGATDLIFPHHENEIAQSEAASGKRPFVKVWVHNGLLNIGSRKMSKSLGNVMKAREFLTLYGGEFTRFLFLSLHYKVQMDFTEEAIAQALTSLERIYDAKKRAIGILGQKSYLPDTMMETQWGEFCASLRQAENAIGDHFANDLNTAGAIAELFILIRDFNRILSQPKAMTSPSANLASQLLIALMEKSLGDVLGIFRQAPDKMLEDLSRIRKAQAGGKVTEPEILNLIQARNDARKTKDFKRADEIRDELLSKGVEIKDSPQGTSWKYS